MTRYIGDRKQGRDRRNLQYLLSASLTIACILVSGCDMTGIGSGLLRFGQSGEVRVTVETPLHLERGWLKQEITWRSDGGWEIREEIGYQGIVGEQDRRPNTGLPVIYAGDYATLIQSLNDDDRQNLVGYSELDLVKDPECGPGTSRVGVRISDSRRRQTQEWIRCASGTFATLTTQGSGPDVAAARVVQAVITVRNYTVGEDFRSVYVGSLPFATIDKGTETRWTDDEPIVFRAPDGAGTAETQAALTEFWRGHTGQPDAAAPEIDWEQEMVLVGLIGQREEVGDSAEIRGVVTVADGTKIELWERVPGDFCAPTRQVVWPFHIVVAPRAPAPVEFTDEVKRDLVPCGTS